MTALAPVPLRVLLILDDDCIGRLDFQEQERVSTVPG